MKILDATCGFRGIWYQKNHPFVTFMDKRKCVVRQTPGTKKTSRSKYNINPDVVSEWKDAPFPNDFFDMVIFDPPHLIIDRNHGKLSSLNKFYGYLYKDNYKRVLREGISKLFGCLKPDGFFIFKWCENSVRVEDILKLFPYKPFFGSNTKSKGYTQNFWIVFIKNDMNKKLEGFVDGE